MEMEGGVYRKKGRDRCTKKKMAKGQKEKGQMYIKRKNKRICVQMENKIKV